jgi:hypothetical protein
MKIYQSINELLEELPNLDGYGFFFYNREEWNANPRTAKIMHIDGIEEEEMDLVKLDFDDLPPIVYENKMRRFFEVETMRDIISVQQTNKPNSTTDDFIKAINYYAEYDTFLPK